MFSNQHPFHYSEMENLKEIRLLKTSRWRGEEEETAQWMSVMKIGRVNIISEGYQETEHRRRLRRNNVRDDEPDLL